MAIVGKALMTVMSESSSIVAEDGIFGSSSIVAGDGILGISSIVAGDGIFGKFVNCSWGRYFRKVRQL